MLHWNLVEEGSAFLILLPTSNTPLGLLLNLSGFPILSLQNESIRTRSLRLKDVSEMFSFSFSRWQ